MFNSIRGKLFAAFGVNLLLLIILVGVSVQSILSIQSAASEQARYDAETWALKGVRVNASIVGASAADLIINGGDKARKDLLERKALLEWTLRDAARLTVEGRRTRQHELFSLMRQFILQVDQIQRTYDRRSQFSNADLTATYRQLDGNVDALRDRMLALTEELIAANDEDLRRTRAALAASVGWSLFFITAMGLLAIVLGATVTVLFSTRLSRGITEVAKAAEGISRGNLDQQLTIRSRDELGQMTASFERMIAYLREVVAVTEAMSEGDHSERLAHLGESDRFGRQIETKLRQSFEVVAQTSRALEETKELAQASDAIAKAIIHSALDGVLVLDRQARIKDMNPAAEAIFSLQRQAACGTSLLDLFHERDQERIRRSLATMSTSQVRPPIHAHEEFVALRPGGNPVPVTLSFTQLSAEAGGDLVGFVRDLTATKRLEMELLLSQKLEAVGRLAAGIAHEINTPIQFVGDSSRYLETSFQDHATLIQSYRSFIAAVEGDANLSRQVALVRQAEEDADLAYAQAQIPKAIDRILDGVDRVATIVRAMKEFAYPDLAQKKPADLNKALLSTLTVARNELKYTAAIETDLGELPPVVCLLGDLNQVFLNLLINAADAIASANGTSGEMGKIRVCSRREGDSVVITIQDTGTGIPPAIHDKIFDLFFTTKEVGKGTGQGLGIARSIIVDKHQGRLGFETEEGVGTTFIIHLPIDPPGEGSKASA